MKKILSGTALLIVIFCFFKFGGIHKNNISIEQTSNQREKLTLWAYYEVEAQQKSLDKLIKDFNLSQDTYFLSWEYVPMTDFTKRLSLGFTENELPDLVIIDNPDMFTYITLGLFEDITEYMSNKQDINDYYPEVLHSVIYNGRYYGLPFCSNNVALYYNKDLFKKAGLEPPKTWDEFKEAAYILTDEDTYGFAMCAMNSEEGAFQFLPWILSTGATIETIGDQNAFRAYKILQELISMGALSGECINWTQIDVARKFIAGEAAMMDGKHYGIPFATNCTALFYNKDLFDAAGIPYPDENTTWKEFREMAKALTKNGVYGFGNAATNTDEGTFQCLQWLYTAGGSYTDIESGIEAYELMQEMIKEGSWTKEVVNWTQSDVNNNFMAGNIAMQQNGPWQIPVIKANAPDLNYGVTVLPKFDENSGQATSILGGENIGVVNKEDMSGAVAFIKYYNQTDIMVEAMKMYGSFPPKTEAAKNPYWTDDPIQAAFIKQLETSIPRGPSASWPSYSAVIQTGFQEVMTLAKTPEQAAKDVQAAVNAVK